MKDSYTTGVMTGASGIVGTVTDPTGGAFAFAACAPEKRPSLSLSLALVSGALWVALSGSLLLFRTAAKLCGPGA